MNKKVEIETALEYLKLNAAVEGVPELARRVVDEPFFAYWSAASKPEHPREVVGLCKQTNANLGLPCDGRQLFLAALFHDIGKLYDYVPTDAECTVWAPTSHKRKIGHLSRSALVWDDASRTIQRLVGDLKTDYSWLTTEYSDEILHAILAHHGDRAAGSPIGPKTKLAWILHLCDKTSARVADCDRFDPFAG